MSLPGKEIDDHDRTLFEDSPISLWEVDFSAARARLVALEMKHGDLERYLRENPDEVRSCLALKKIVDVNQRTLQLYRAESKAQLLAGLDTISVPGPGPDELLKLVLSIAAGDPAFEAETVHHTLEGKPIDILMRWRVAKGHASSYDRVMVSIIDLTERRQAEEALKRSREELRNLAAYQESAREEERTRISREIHDLLGQDLTALKLDLAWMRNRIPAGNDALLRKIESMSALLDSTAKTVRRISKSLRPAMLDDLGLVEAVALYIREFEERTGIACKVTLPDHDMPANREMATAFFRILQEALTNVVRHAEASQVSLHLYCDGKHGTLRIADDGKGVSEAQLRSAKSFGLMGIRERVAALGGTVSIIGEAGKGTTIEVMVPCIRGENCRC